MVCNMDARQADIQLEMNFSTPSGNRFRRCLENGVFTVLFEVTAPGYELPDDEAAARLAQLEKTALSCTKLPCALALTDRSWSDKHRSALEYAALLPEKNRNSHIFYISGRHADHSAMRSKLAAARSLNLANLVAVSGTSMPNEDARALRKIDFTESVHTLQMLREQPDKQLFYPGSTINANLYSAPGLYSSIFKLIKKFNTGSEFAVTQAGFDIAQLDNLRTYLSWRGFHQPLIARLMLLTPDKVDKITANAMPGINISGDFLQILDKELRFSSSQFEAAQYRRLELQAVGCKLLGYSGIQIAGADSVNKMQITMDRIDRALKEFSNLNQWAEEYKYYMARSDMAPGEKDFYLFEKLLDSNAEERIAPQLTEFTLPVRSFGGRCREKLTRFLFPEADQQPAAERHWLKKLLTGCPGCANCRLPQTQYHCPQLCPKELANGPCGGVRDNGLCEAADIPCVHLDIWLDAERRKACDALENDLIAPGR
ncbi:MAG: hypothetical protein E7047_02940 [Lentisphaerae bacterium]|nr:hypothetical protein [Lentisphaerota bacterium]